MGTTKQCRACKEEINASASWCPKCHRPQSVIRALIAPQALVILVAALAGYWYFTNQAMEGNFDDLSSDAIYETVGILEVSEVSMQVGKSGCKTCVSTLGKITNQSDKPYTGIHLEVTYYNEDGKIIDVVNDENMGLVIGPGAEGRFRVKTTPASDADQYAKSEVRVTKAKQDRSWY
jgi:uncharacterized protein (UPF0212 family)